MRYFALLSLVGVFVCTAFTQELDNGIFLNNTTVYPATISNTASRDMIEWPTNNCSTGDCFAIIQLMEIPDNDQKSILLNAGINLHDYIPNRAYLASRNSLEELDLPDFVTAVLPLEAVYKRPSTPIALSSGAEGEFNYHLIGIPFPNVSPILLSASLAEIGAVVTYLDAKQVKYRISANLLQEVLNCPLLQYTESVPRAPFAEGKIGRSNLRLRGVNQGPGMGYDGKGISIAIADDGTVNHLDFHGRLNDHTQYNTGDHGEMTVGMAAGAGNIDELAKGSAPSVDIHLFDIGNYEHILNAVANFNEYGIVITSTSYGEGCGDDYNINTKAIDEQVYQNQQLLHCFSAGNHATEPCFNPYSWLGPNSDGAYYATITGGRKAGKNVLAVGNNEWSDALLASSSRGPTMDGRIKPDLCALGQADYTTGVQNSYRQSSGTSAAAPNVAGALACLYQYFKETHNGQYPSSALIKAMALNTADDQGPAGPDFSYGWGRLNAANALESLEQHQYFENQIRHGQQHSFQFPVPVGARKLKVMLYWHDPAGSVLSSLALVNDLDLSLRTPSWDVNLPWIPNSTPHLDSLALDARPGVDRLNNVEQVVIESPAPGYYNVLIDGYQIPEGAQSYVIVYQIETAPIRVVYPQEGTSFVPQEQALISWDAVGDQGHFRIDYSIDNGQNWLQMEGNIPGNRRSFLWAVPTVTTSNLKVRVSRNSDVSVSEGLAIVAPLPIFDVIYMNPTRAQISWNNIPGATAYAIYVLGNEHMELVGTTSELSYLLPANIGEEYWISVAPIIGNKKGRRANARSYQHYGCESQVNLEIQFDQYPGETAWYILDNNGNIIESSGLYTGQNPNSFISLNICLPPGCFTLVMTDTYNDGLCCNDGYGYFRLKSANGNILAEGADFDGYTYNLFCPEEQVNTPMSISTQVIQQVSCFGQQDGAAKVVASGGSGSYNYQWSNGTQSSTIQGLRAGQYQVTVIDGETSQVQSVQIVEPSPIYIQYSVQDANCGDGVISVNATGGTPPYTYTWSDNGTGAYRQGLAAGSYFLVVNDINGCTNFTNIIVGGGESLQVQLIGNSPNCMNGNDGSITSVITGGQGDYQLQWSNGQQNVSQISGLSVGTYTLMVTSGSCQLEQTVTLTSPLGLAVSANQVAPSCFNSADAYINVNISGGLAPYQYQWSNGQHSSFIGNLSSGIYLLTITDSNGCNTTRGYQLNAPTQLHVQAQVVAAQGEIGGSASLSIGGGSPPYSIQWSNGAQENNVTNLAPGHYSVVITDAHSCTVSTSVIIEQQDSNPGDNLTYCSMRGASTAYEWIEAITVNGDNYHSGNDGGYGDYSNTNISLFKNSSQVIELLPAYSSTSYNEHWAIWIDYNQDGDFNDANEFVTDYGPAQGLATISFNVPLAALPGQTRMRIAMQYSHTALLCDNITYGEVEDYTVNIESVQSIARHPVTPSSEVSSKENVSWSVYPNPVVEWAVIEGKMLEKGSVSILVYHQNGQLMNKEVIQSEKGFFTYSVNMEDYPSGVYSIELKGESWQDILRVVK